MSHILILYGTGEGQTAKITEYMAGIFREKGHDVTTQDGKKLPAQFSLADYDAVIVGASIHVGQHQGYMIDVVKRLRDDLVRVPTAFFSVCLTARKTDPAARTEIAQYIANFEEKSGCHPDMSTTFAGALPYTKYGFFKRFLMKRINQSEGGDTDTSRDYEYTDWNEVKAFANEFLRRLEAVPA